MCLVVLSIVSLEPPEIANSVAPAEFSSARAKEYLKPLVSKPHPIGSSAHADVRDRIFGELVKMGLQPQVQRATAINTLWTDGPYRAGTVENIVAKVPGTASTRAVLLVGHYDAAPNSLGASDNGAAVVALLETVRALKSGAPLKNDVIMLATDGEEVGLLGATAFVQQHPWAKDVGVVLNFEARGSSGPSIMFQTSDDNGWLIEEFAKTADRPVATSLSMDIYKLMPNDTDFTVFAGSGMSGLNFAYIEGSSAYHSSLDNLTNLDERSLQHHGMYALELARHFGNVDLNGHLKKSDAVYFDLFGRTLVHYSRTIGLVMAVLVTLGSLALIVFGLKRQVLTVSGQVLGLLAMLLSMIVSTVLSMLAWWLIVTFGGVRASLLEADTATNHLYLTGFALLTIASTATVYALFRKRVSIENLAIGALLWFLLLLVTSLVYLPGGSYLLLWPLFFALIAWTLKFALPSKTLFLIAISFLCATPGIILLVPMIYQIFVAFGVSQTTVLVVPLTLLLGLCLLSFDLIARAGKWLLPAVSAVAAVSFIFAALVQLGDDSQAVKSNEIFYALNADTGKAVWASGDAEPDEWTSQFLSTNVNRTKMTENFPWVTTDDFLQNQAEPAALPTPEIKVLEDQTQDQTRSLKLRVISARGAATLTIHLENKISEAFVNGQVLSNQQSSEDGWRLVYSAPPREGIELLLRTRPSDPLKMTVVDHSYQLPEFTNSVIKARPSYITPLPFSYSDSTFITKTISLPASLAQN